MNALNSKPHWKPWTGAAAIRSWSKKWGLTACAATALVIGLLGTAYGICGFTPAAHKWDFLHSLTALNTAQLSVIIVGWGILSCVSMGILIHLHRAAKPYVDSTTLSKLDQLSSELSLPPQIVQEIKEFLENGFEDYKSHYRFYYHLSTISEHVMATKIGRTRWKAFLERIDKQLVLQNEYEYPTYIDCTQEIRRLKRIKTEFKAERLDRESATFAQDIVEVNDICREAFPNWSNQIDYFFKEKNEPYVVRERGSGAILAIIVAQEQMLKNSEKCLFVHTFARRAPAVKLGLTEYVRAKVELTSYKFVYCQVLNDNVVAQKIYRKMGFVSMEKSFTKNYHTMIYRPKKR